ncbi:hypothetical protein LguiA_020040 [Lonicera macranthoides]
MADHHVKTRKFTKEKKAEEQRMADGFRKKNSGLLDSLIIAFPQIIDKAINLNHGQVVIKPKLELYTNQSLNALGLVEEGYVHPEEWVASPMPHSTTLTERLDWAYFSSVKEFWSQLLLEWHRLKEIQAEDLLVARITRLSHMGSLNGLILKRNHTKESMNFIGRFKD